MGSHSETSKRRRAVSLKIIVAMVVACSCTAPGIFAQGAGGRNSSAAAILPSGLPDPLTLSDGARVTTPAQWKRRRQEILHLLTEQMYGRMPDRPARMRFEVFDRDPHALGGKATREQIHIFFQGRKDGPRMDLLVYIPNWAKRPPVILGLNFWGNETVSTDPGIRISDRWVESSHNPFIDLSCVHDNRATAACRGIDVHRWPVEKILDAGYALATAYRGDIDPDRSDGYAESIRSAWPELARGGDNFSAIAAWAWALSRGLDYLETDRLVDAHRVVAFGWSRLGKAAVWAAATDPRFAALISNESGAGGVKLFHHLQGETVLRLNTHFPYWYCKNFRQYDNRDGELPFDQNEVLALVAPRPLYIASAIDDHNSDPLGEFLGGVAVTPVYRFLGKPGLPVTEWPPVNHPVLGRISYHVRSGGHDVTDYDWDQYLKFCDRYVRKNAAR
jgi:hypothetical protein